MNFRRTKKRPGYKLDKKEEQKEWLKSYEVRSIVNISAGTLAPFRRNGRLRLSKIAGLLYYKHDEAGWRGDCKYVFSCSTEGRHSLVPYTAAKHYMLGITKKIAVQYAAQNIRADVLCPYYLETPLLASAPDGTR